MKDRNVIVWHLLFVGLLAVIARGTYLLLALEHLGADGLVVSIPDTSVYLAQAEHILSGPNGAGKLFMFWIGPGYGLIVAVIQFIFGSNLLLLNWFNVLMGSAGAVLIYLLGYQLTDSKAVAFIAALIAALSSTSLAVSANILSDQPYYTFHAAALLCFTIGVKKERMRWLVAAGLLAGYAAYIRALGQMWPPVYLLIPLILLKKDPVLRFVSKSRFRIMKNTAITAGLAAIMILGWAARNWTTEGVFVFGGNGVRAARVYVVARAVADHSSDMTIRDVRRQFTEEDSEYFGDAGSTLAQKYHRAKEEFIKYAKEHPRWVAEAFWNDVVDNFRAGNYIAKSQIPRFSTFWWRLIDANRTWLGDMILLFSALGFALLLWERRTFAAALLGFTFVYFSLIIGFSFWQGSRLHYPAEIGWSILGAFAVVRIITMIISLGGKSPTYLHRMAEAIQTRWSKYRS